MSSRLPAGARDDIIPIAMTRRTAITTTTLAIGGLIAGCGKDKKMVKHVILWKLKDDVADKNAVKAGIKAGLEGLKGIVPGLTEIIVRTEGLASSNADVMLDSTLESEEALKGYAVHPAHVKVANEKVRPFTQTRLCLDYLA